MPIRIGERPPMPPPAPITTSVPSKSAEKAEPSAFSKLVSSLGNEVQRGENVVKDAVAATKAGRDLGATELLALQAGVYRYSEVVDLAAKLVDRASSGVKTVIQGQ
jgi:hypothetical protein